MFGGGGATFGAAIGLSGFADFAGELFLEGLVLSPALSPPLGLSFEGIAEVLNPWKSADPFDHISLFPIGVFYVGTC